MYCVTHAGCAKESPRGRKWRGEEGKADFVLAIDSPFSRPVCPFSLSPFLSVSSIYHIFSPQFRVSFAPISRMGYYMNIIYPAQFPNVLVPTLLYPSVHTFSSLDTFAFLLFFSYSVLPFPSPSFKPSIHLFFPPPFSLLLSFLHFLPFFLPFPSLLILFFPFSFFPKW